ncbi:MAG: hypothetical protein IT314_13350 [Anaerolineales bacterium]|nr:hypothetical protein [Anaerolineales bacterium]
MNHQPFEAWLLDQTTLSSEQKRKLEAHVRTCAYCAALVKVDKALRDLRRIPPAAGFAPRFEARLAAYKEVDRKRRLLGLIVFILSGAALALWAASPFLSGFFTSPASWIRALVEWGVFLTTTLLASLQAGAVILDVLEGFLPPFAWMVLFSGTAGISLFWSISIWRFAQRVVPRGV